MPFSQKAVIIKVAKQLTVASGYQPVHQHILCRILQKMDSDIGVDLEAELYHDVFSKDFLWGVATSAFQTEGGWNEDGKGESIWDHYVHQHPEKIMDKSNGDIACDSYHKYEEDIKMLQELGVNCYRFSMSWPRLLPEGTTEKVNLAGVQYYNKIIDLIISKNIKPIVTMYQWDYPQALHEKGGWLEDSSVQHFRNYAEFCFQTFGDRVKWWVTINEPSIHAIFSYSNGMHAPFQQVEGGEYVAVHNMLKAHAEAWHLYDQKFRLEQQGKVSISIPIFWQEPASQTPADKAAAERATQFYHGWVSHPIFSSDGDYPAIMKEQIQRKSQEEGRSSSRLSQFDDYWKKRVQGTFDYFALQHYCAFLVRNDTSNTQKGQMQRDGDFLYVDSPSWIRPCSHLKEFAIVPWGFRKTLNWIRKEYNNVPVLVTENGMCDDGGLDDQHRILYFKYYINEMLKANKIDGCNIVGYTAWALMDDFEWPWGYLVRFGLYSVDFEDPKRPRKPKKSAGFYKNIIACGGFPK